MFLIRRYYSSVQRIAQIAGCNKPGDTLEVQVKRQGLADYYGIHDYFLIVGLGKECATFEEQYISGYQRWLDERKISIGCSTEFGYAAANIRRRSQSRGSCAIGAQWALRIAC